MAQAFATALETSRRMICLGVSAVTRGRTERGLVVLKLCTGLDVEAHLLGVGLPIGRDVQSSTAGKSRGQQIDERRLHQSSLVMTLLRPGIRKEQLHLIETARCNLLLE